MTVQTDAGLISGKRISENIYRIGINLPSVVDLNRLPDAAYVELGDPGVPHCVTEILNLSWDMRDALRETAVQLRHHQAFPKGANVNFYTWLDENTARILTYERYVEDFTYACGTGTGSVVSVLTKKGLVSGKNVKVNMTGGQLIIDVDFDGEKVSNIYLTGPTNVVCQGEVTDEDLVLN